MNMTTITFPETAKSVGDRIKFLRDEKGLTREQLATKLGVSHRTLGHYEQGTTSPTIATLYRIASQLQVAPKALVFGSGNDTMIDEKNTHQLDEHGKAAVAAIAKLTVMRIEGFKPENRAEVEEEIKTFVKAQKYLDIPELIYLAVGRDVIYQDILDKLDDKDQEPAFINRIFDKTIIGKELDLLTHGEIVAIAEVAEIYMAYPGYEWSDFDVPTIAEFIREEVYEHCLSGEGKIHALVDQISSGKQ